MYMKNPPDSHYNHLFEGKHHNSFTEILVPPLEKTCTEQQTTHTPCVSTGISQANQFFLENYFLFQISLEHNQGTTHICLLHFLQKFWFTDLLKSPV